MAHRAPLPEEPINIPPCEPAVMFLDNQITGVHPKFGQLKPTYSAEDGRFVESTERKLVAIDETQEMQRQQELFMKAVAKFESGKDGVKTGVRLDASACHSWTDVMQELQSIEDKYSRAKDEGTAGRIRHCLRSMRKWRTPCEQWLKLLPTDSWQGSLLCGGIKLVLTAASNMDLVHDEIVDSINDIPFTIEIVFKLSRVYNTEAMQSHVSQLFVAILQLLQECLKWLKKHPVRKGFSAIVKGDDHATGLREQREQLDRLTAKIDKLAMVGLHESVQETNERTRMGSHVLNSLHDFVKEGEIRLAQAREESARHQRNHEMAERDLRLVMEIQKRRYLEDIQYDPAKPVKDLISCTKAAPTTYLRAQDRAAWVLRSGQINVWVLESHSQIMVINSHEASHERHSPVSLFSAMLAQSLFKARAGTILYWSCGENVHGNTKDIVRHIVGQLLQEEQHSMSATVLSMLAGFKVSDFDALLAVLIQLLKERLESSSVFIVLDSISFFEDKRRMMDTRQLFDELHSFIHTWKSRYPLKVLATSPTRCSYLGTFLDDWDPTVLSVPEVVEGDRLRRVSFALPPSDQDEEDEREG